jgi:drug/metabolite transporter (DMT)-like permease
MSAEKNLTRAYLALGVGVVSIGFSGIFVRWADAPGIVTSFYRMAIAALLMGIPFLRRQQSRPAIPKTGFLLAILGGVFFAADIATWSTGVVLAGATNPTLLANTAPVWVGLGALLIFRERLPRRFWLGLAIAMTGATLVLGLDTLQDVQLGTGSLLGLLAGLFYGAYYLVTQRGRNWLDSLSYFWLSSLASAVALLILSIILELPLVGFPRTTYLTFLGMALVSQVSGYLAINFALGHLPASVVSVTLLGQPVVTAILAAVLLGEILGGFQIVGGAAVLAGVSVIHLSRATDSVASTST